MPTFDPGDIKSPDAAAQVHFTDLLAERLAWQEICDAQGIDAAAKKADALTYIVYGAHLASLDQRVYTKSEVITRKAEAHVHPKFPTGSFAVLDPGGPDPLIGGEFQLEIRRIATIAETSTEALRSNLYMWFYDRVHWLKNDIITSMNVEDCPRLNSVSMEHEPAYIEFDATAANGEMLYARMLISWGDQVDQ